MGSQSSKQFGQRPQGTIGSAQGRKYQLMVDKDCFTQSLKEMGDNISFYDIARTAVTCSDKYKEQQEKIKQYQEMTEEEKQEYIKQNQLEKEKRMEIIRDEARPYPPANPSSANNLGRALQEKKDEMNAMFEAKEKELLARADLTAEEKKDELKKFMASMKTNWDSYVDNIKETQPQVAVLPPVSDGPVIIKTDDGETIATVTDGKITTSTDETVAEDSGTNIEGFGKITNNNLDIFIICLVFILLIILLMTYLQS